MEQATVSKMLSVGEAAKRLDVKYHTVLSWTRIGCPIDGSTVYLRCECVGTRTRIPPDAIEEFKAACLKARRGDAAVAESEETPDEFDRRAAEAVARFNAKHG